MNKEKIHEFCRSFLSDDQGDLNDNQFQILNDQAHEITVRFFTPEAGACAFRGFEHTTYNSTLALCAFADGLHVSVAHPDDDDVRMFTEDEIVDAEGHLFVIRKDTL